MLKPLARTALRSWSLRHLKTVQNGLCPLCGLEIDTGIKGEAVVDHDHATGEIRGVLHRSCNGAEGKVLNAAGRWGAKTMQTESVLQWLERLIEYHKSVRTGLKYPYHLDADEKRKKRNAGQIKARAAVAARKAMAKERRSKADKDTTR